MIEIDDPPNITGCAPCGSALIWLYSARRSVWVAFVPAGDEHTIRPHPCRHAQEPVTWRQLDHGDPPSAEYLAAKESPEEQPLIEGVSTMTPEQIREVADALALDAVREIDTDTILRHLEENADRFDHTDVDAIELLLTTGDVSVEFPEAAGEY